MNKTFLFILAVLFWALPALYFASSASGASTGTVGHSTLTASSPDQTGFTLVRAGGGPGGGRGDRGIGGRQGFSGGPGYRGGHRNRGVPRYYGHRGPGRYFYGLPWVFGFPVYAPYYCNYPYRGYYDRYYCYYR